MPMIDMPLDELRNYQGTNPCPDDHSEFWDTSIEQMERVDPQLVLQPASFTIPGVECFELWFSGVGGARIHAKYLRPARAKNCPAIVEYHGYSGSSGDWFGKLAWVGQGYAIAIMDCRGQGGLSEDLGGVYGNTLNGHIIRGLDSGNPSKLLFRNIFLDAAQLVRIVMDQPEVDETKVGTHGGSQGGALSIAAASLVPEVARCSTYYPFLSDFLRVWQMDLTKDAYQELRDYFRRFDPTHEREERIFKRLGYIDIQYLAHRIQAKTLMGTGLMDTICPPSTQFAAYNKITAEKDMVIYPDFGHEHLPTHPDRVLQFMNEMR